MIDSVRLILPNKELHFKYADRHKVNHRTLRRYEPDHDDADDQGYVKKYDLIQKGEKEDLKINGVYHPRLSQKINSMGRSLVTVEFSIPKFLYGTNLVEFSEKTLNIERFFVDKLFPYLKPRIKGLYRGSDLFYAEVVRIDFCKNVLLRERDTDIDWVLEMISTMNLARRNLAQKDYYDHRTKGKSVAFYNTWYSINFYDKLKEIASHRHKTLNEKDICKFVNSKKVKQVLRVETSLQNKSAINKWFRDLYGKNRNSFILEDFWKLDIARKTLLKDLDELYDDEFNLFTRDIDIKETILFAKLRDMKLSFSQIKNYMFLNALIKDVGPRQAKAMIKKHVSPRSYSTYRKLYKQVKDDTKGFSPFTFHQTWGEIKRQVSEFNLIHLDSAGRRLIDSND